MSSMYRIALGPLLALALAWATVSRGIPQKSPEEELFVAQLASSGGAFHARGQVGGLYPGASRGLRLTVVNRSPSPLSVTSIRVSVGDANPGCGSATLVPTSFRGSVWIQAWNIKRLKLPVRMRLSAPDACQGALYPLTFIGTAR
jgi:hypothetical protein